MSPAERELCFLSAAGAMELFRQRKLSPRDLIKAQIARCEEVNPKLNAITHSHFERALALAQAAEDRYFRDHHVRPLEGVTLAVKDLHPIAGEITTFGSAIFEHNRPTHTAPTVARLAEAGAIIHIQTTTPEFGYAGATNSPLWGTTRNPWNLDFAPGGSTGGGAASVASGMSTLADGTDGGGSVRIAASACGLVGYLPPYGRNPLDLDHPAETWLRYGPITHTVQDAALMQNVMSGVDRADMGSLRQSFRIPETFDSIKGAKVALSVDLGYFEVDPEVASATRRAAETFRDLGCDAHEVELGWTSEIMDAFYLHWEAAAAATLAPYLAEWRDRISPHFVSVIEKGLKHTAADLYRVKLVQGQMYASLAHILEEHEILISPTLAVPSVAANHSNLDRSFSINGRPVDPYLQWCLTYPFNMMTSCPAITVPNGYAASGVPIGLHISARSYDDLRVFQAAASFEKAAPWTRRRPDI